MLKSWKERAPILMLWHMIFAITHGPIFPAMASRTLQKRSSHASIFTTALSHCTTSSKRVSQKPSLPFFLPVRAQPETVGHPTKPFTLLLVCNLLGFEALLGLYGLWQMMMGRRWRKYSTNTCFVRQASHRITGMQQRGLK